MTVIEQNELIADDLHMFKNRAIDIYNSIPGRCRLKGMNRDLTESERVSLAYIESVIIILGQYGYLTPEQIEQAVPKVFVKVNESVHED